MTTFAENQYPTESNTTQLNLLVAEYEMQADEYLTEIESSVQDSNRMELELLAKGRISLKTAQRIAASQQRRQVVRDYLTKIKESYQIERDRLQAVFRREQRDAKQTLIEWCWSLFCAGIAIRVILYLNKQTGAEVIIAEDL